MPGKKVCPVCGGNCGPNDVECPNCKAPLKGNVHLVERSSLPKGKQGNPLDRNIAAQSVMPTNEKVVTRSIPESMTRRIKREEIEELSDEFVDPIEVNKDRMNQIRHSADHLGL